MSGETIVVRGTELELARFHVEMDAFLANQQVDVAQLPRSNPATVKRKMTDRAVLGHEAFLEIAIEVGKAVAIGALSAVMKDLVIAWIKEQAKKQGLLTETKPG